MKPVVAIVGRPNVGKSTLLNRIIGRRDAIVEQRPGVTRDRKEVDANWRGREFTLVDTGGWLFAGDQLDQKVSRQSEQAIADADVVLFVVDVTVGVTEDDARVAALLRPRAGSVVVVANKVDDDSREALIWDLLSFGLGDPEPVSAIHGRRTGDLLDRVLELLPEESEAPVEEELDEDRIVGVALIGRPNVGKSTLFNRLIGEERAVVHDQPGTTRDSIDTVVETDHGPVRFIDTAGMRRRARIDERTEYYSLVRALRSLDTADVALLLFAILGGACLFFALFVLQATLCFWTVEALELMNTMSYGGVESAQYPLVIHGTWFRRFFTFIVPLACICYFPIVGILDRSDPLGTPYWFQCVAPVAGIAFLLVVFQAWHFGVSRYTSTGS